MVTRLSPYLSPHFSRIRIVLCRPSHPGNIGAAARAMKAMGLSDLRLVAPEKFPAPEARWMATNAIDILARSITAAEDIDSYTDFISPIPRWA